MSSMCFLMSSIVFPHVINCVPSRHQALLKTVTWSSACSRMHTGSPHPVLMRNGDAPSGDTPMDLHASRSTAKHYIILQSERPTYRTIPYNTKLYYTILYYNILYYTILYYTIPYQTLLYYTILYYTILYYTILYYTILYYTILSAAKHSPKSAPHLSFHTKLDMLSYTILYIILYQTLPNILQSQWPASR